MTPTFITSTVHPVWLAGAREWYAPKITRPSGFGEAHALVIRSPGAVTAFKIAMRAHAHEIEFGEFGPIWRGLPVLFRYNDPGAHVEIITREAVTAIFIADAEREAAITAQINAAAARAQAEADAMLEAEHGEG
jgi:hypothetical protein